MVIDVGSRFKYRSRSVLCTMIENTTRSYIAEMSSEDMLRYHVGPAAVVLAKDFDNFDVGTMIAEEWQRLELLPEDNAVRFHIYTYWKIKEKKDGLERSTSSVGKTADSATQGAQQGPTSGPSDGEKHSS